MKKVFAIYWIWYLIWEYVKTLSFHAPMWVAENFTRLDYANLFFIPIGYMAVDFVMQDKKDYKFMFYCMASFMARVFVFMLSINQYNEVTQSAYRSTTAQYVYGITFLVAILLEKPFTKKMNDVYLKQIYKK